MESYSKKITITATPEEIYTAITTREGLIHWWTNDVEIYTHIGGTATFRFGKNRYVVMKISKLLPHKDVVWKCVEQNFTSKGTVENEWVGSILKFSIHETNQGFINFTFIHEGLTPNLTGYKQYQADWEYYLGSLKNYLEKGKGSPFRG